MRVFWTPATLVLLSAALLAAAVVAGAVLVPWPPAPNGPDAVGRAELVLRDPEGRAIPVTAWYPVAPASAGGRAPLATLPLILYSPGWAGTREYSAAQAANLASHGFVVVACDDVASNASTDPDHGVGLDFTSDEATQISISRARRHAEVQAALLMRILQALSTDDAGFLKGRLNLDRVGVLGFSIGGTTGVQLASMDSRIVAVFNVDGGFLDPTPNALGNAAYFAMSSGEAFLPASHLTSPESVRRNNAIITARDNELNRTRASRPNGYWAAIDSADHGDLSDQLFTINRRRVLRSPFERAGIIAALRAYQAAFFKHELLGQNAPLLSGRPLNQYVRWVTSTPEASTAASAQR